VEQVASLGQSHEEQFKALLAKVKQAAGLRVMAHECARDASPYVHAKLSAVTVKGDSESPLEMNVTLTTQDRARAFAAFVAKTKTDKTGR
jgi:UTP:GlnB (protein PII) uridylyltransferase